MEPFDDDLDDDLYDASNIEPDDEDQDDIEEDRYDIESDGILFDDDRLIDQYDEDDDNW